MKALTVNESLRKLLKPKSPEEIKNALKDIKLASYNLKSFFRLTGAAEAKILKKICEEIFLMDPYEFDICRMSESIENILKKAFSSYHEYKTITLDQSDPRRTSMYYGDQYKIFFEYSSEYKLIRFGGGSGGWSYYWAFPRKEIGNILFAITDQL
jgi:hypothetical protein